MSPPDNLIDEPKRRTPLHIRLLARWAVISLLIAVSGLIVASLQPPSWTTAFLKLVIAAASTVGVASLLFWVVFSGLHFVFTRHKQDTIESSGDLW